MQLDSKIPPGPLSEKWAHAKSHYKLVNPANKRTPTLGRERGFFEELSPEQVRAWDQCIPWLQRECRELAVVTASCADQARRAGHHRAD